MKQSFTLRFRNHTINANINEPDPRAMKYTATYIRRSDNKRKVSILFEDECYACDNEEMLE